MTCVEVVVVVILCLAVFWILLQVLREKDRMRPLICGTNLCGLGKAMLIYANDYGDRLPRAGGPAGLWAARLPDWKAQTAEQAYGLEPNDPGGASISASLYLLVKHAEVDPKCFVCPFDEGVTTFKPKKYGIGSKELIDLWDFGPDPPRHVSYAYH